MDEERTASPANVHSPLVTFAFICLMSMALYLFFFVVLTSLDRFLASLRDLLRPLLIDTLHSQVSIPPSNRGQSQLSCRRSMNECHTMASVICGLEEKRREDKILLSSRGIRRI